MASLQERNRSYRVIFRHQGRQHFVTIGVVSPQEAEAKSAQVSYLLMRIKQGLIELPPGVGIAEFVEHDGKPPIRLAVQSGERKSVTLGTLRDRFLATRATGREKSTLYTAGIHFKHMVATLGERFTLESLAQADLQRHIERRAKLDRSPVTIKKEITTLRTAWHWAIHAGLLAGEYPNKGLVYPKDDELPPYQTREEIERQVAAGGLTLEQIDELWHALYLRPSEIAELLEHVRTHARHMWIYPLVCVAAHTGTRRSELIRMLASDVDFAGGSVTIREKKRVKGKRSTRRAPLTPTLRAALEAWLVVHPGGPTLFCQAGEVAHSKKRSSTTGHQTGKDRATTLSGRMATVKGRENLPEPEPLTPSECHNHFKRSLAGSKWDVVRGLHTLRHSVASCLDRLTVPRFDWEFGTMITSPSLENVLREITIMAKPLLPDELWKVIEPLLPKWTPSPKGGQPPVTDRAALTGILFVLKTGIPWEDLPCEMNCGCGMTCWRRLRDWQADGTWDKIHKVLLDKLRGADKINWKRALIDSSFVRAAYGGEATGPSPVDRSKPGTKHHLMTDASGIPLASSVTAANVNDISQLAPLYNAVPPVAGKVGHPRNKPDALQGDLAYDSEPHRQGLREMGIEPVLPEKGIDDQSGLGETRWPVERTLSWVHQNRRLRIRYERRSDIHQAFLTLACIKICASALFTGYC